MENCCGEVLWRSVVLKCCGEVLRGCREVLQRGL